MATSAGIDVGSDAIKAIVLTGGTKSPVEILSAGTLPLGELGRMDEGEDKTLALGMKLKELIKSARIKASHRRMAISGQGSSIRYLQVPPVPPWRLDMLVNYEVSERAGGDKEESNTYDYHILDVPEVNGQNTVMIGILKEANATDFLTMAKTAGAGEVEIDHEALSLFAAYYHGHGFDSDKTVLVCDIGADDTTILLCKNGALYFARTVLGGGRRFTQVLADELKIELSEAEDLKKTQGEITFDIAPPTGSAKSTLGRRVPGATNVLPRAGNTNILQRPGGPGASGAGIVGLAGRADASAARPAPMRSTVQPGIPSGAEKPAAPAAPSAPVKVEATDMSGLKLSSPGSLDLDLSIMPLDEQTLPPQTPAIRQSSLPTNAPPPVKAAAPAAPAAPVAPLAAPASFSLGDASDELSLDLDLKPAEPAKAAAAPATQPVSPEAAPSPAVPAQPKAESEASLDMDGPLNPPTTAAQPTAEMSAASPAAAESPDQRKRQISAALLREAASVCAALENTVQASKSQMKLRELKIDRVYLTGGASQLKGLAEFVGRRMRVETAPLEPFKQIAMTRLPPEQAAALRAEQHTLAVAVGAALSNLNLSGTFKFLLWPEALKQRKVFWARGAYLYYTAGMVAASLALFLYTPYRNSEMLKQNFENSEKAVGGAMMEAKSQKSLEDTNEEFFYRNKQVVDNTLSGHYFLTILAELKSNKRISDDVWLTQVSTQLPNVIRSVSGAGEAGAAPARPKLGMLREPGAEPDTFQAQRRIYLRGFVRGNEKGENRILAIRDFYTRLVPHPQDPDHVENLFKDIRPIWFSTSDHKQGAFYLTEFVLEAYTEGTAKREDLTKAGDKDKAKGPAAAPVKAGAPQAGPQAAPGVQLNPVAPAPGAEPRVAPAANPNAANPNPVDPNAEKGPPKKKKFITGDGPGK